MHITTITSRAARVFLACAVLLALSTALHARNPFTPDAAPELRQPRDSGIGGAPSDTAVTIRDSAGTEFFFIYSDNALPFPGALAVITAEQDTQGTLTLPAIGLSESFSVSAGSLTTVSIPPAGVVSGHDRVQQGQAIHVVADDEVTIYLLNPEMPQATNDAYLALPVDILSTHYRVLAWPDTLSEQGSPLGPSQMAIVGAHDGTTVTLTPSTDAGSRLAGASYDVSLDAGDVYVLQAGMTVGGGFMDDLTGTQVDSDRPVAVFAGNRCANIPAGFGTCDHVIEQLFPVDTWGKTFCVAPFAGPPLQGDVLRVLAAQDDTELTINGEMMMTLAAGEIYEQVTFNQAQEIEASAPVMIAQYHTGSDFGGDPSDPSMSLVPPAEQYLDRYTFLTPDGYESNFVKLVAPQSTTASCVVDGDPISGWVDVPGTSFSFVDVPVESGIHRATCDAPFGIQVYGYFQDTSYSYPGGLRLERLVGIRLEPKDTAGEVGETVELIATVRDDRANPVVGTPVQFSIDGPGSAASSEVLTDADGIARLSYGANSAGTDTVVASFAGNDAEGTSNAVQVIWSGTAADPPTASCTELETAECEGGQGLVTLDGRDSSDSAGEPLAYAWSSDTCAIDDPAAAMTEAVCPLGDSLAELVVDNGSARSESCPTQVSVVDSLAPEGGMTAPRPGACYGEADLPLLPTHDFTDRCDGEASVSIRPEGPFADHGDHRIAVVAEDLSGNRSESALEFTIDTVPPTAQLRPGVRWAYRFPQLPFRVTIWSGDEDGAAGGVVHETVTLNGCTIFDGNTYGDGDGLLQDESMSVAPTDLCAMIQRCGIGPAFRPEIVYEATDCAGNVGRDVRRLRGMIQVRSCAIPGNAVGRGGRLPR